MPVAFLKPHGLYVQRRVDNRHAAHLVGMDIAKGCLKLAGKQRCGWYVFGGMLRGVVCGGGALSRLWGRCRGVGCSGAVGGGMGLRAEFMHDHELLFRGIAGRTAPCV